MLELTKCFKERLALDISDCASDFYNGNLGLIACVIAEEPALNLIVI